MHTPYHATLLVDWLIDRVTQCSWEEKLEGSLGSFEAHGYGWNGVFQTSVFLILDRMELIEIFFDSKKQSFRCPKWTAESDTPYPSRTSRMCNFAPQSQKIFSLNAISIQISKLNLEYSILIISVSLDKQLTP